MVTKQGKANEGCTPMDLVRAKTQAMAAQRAACPLYRRTLQRELVRGINARTLQASQATAAQAAAAAAATSRAEGEAAAAYPVVAYYDV